MADRALVTHDRASVLRTAPADAAQLTRPVRQKHYWSDIVEDKPPLQARQRYGVPVLTIRDRDVLRTWPVETAPAPRGDADRLEQELREGSPLLRALVRQIASDKGLTPAQLVALLEKQV